MIIFLCHHLTIFRYASRCLLIEFGLPQLSTTLADYTDLPDLLSGATRSIGFMISLGEMFLMEGISEIDGTIYPKLKDMLPEGIWPRVVPGYATLLWFTEKVIFGMYKIICNYLFMLTVHAHSV